MIFNITDADQYKRVKLSDTYPCLKEFKYEDTGLGYGKIELESFEEMMKLAAAVDHRLIVSNPNEVDDDFVWLTIYDYYIE